MTAITIESKLETRLLQAAERLEKPVAEITDEAIRTYLEWLDHQKLEAEIQAFEKMHEQLRARFAQQFVAIHNGKLIDHDLEFETLFLRVQARLGNTCVLIRHVEDALVHEWQFRGPRLEYA
jgi:predicted transcriptional regulator